MRVRYFGDPWPSPERRAAICDNDRFKVPIDQVVGNRCIECDETIKDNQRGVITACDMRVWGHFWLQVEAQDQDTWGDMEDPEVTGRLVKYSVAAYHLSCWLKVVVGGEMSEEVQDRMHLRPGQVPLTPKEIDELEEQGLTVGEETAEPGEGWFR